MSILLLLTILTPARAGNSRRNDISILQNLAKPQNFQAGRVSSFDRTGGNNDRYSIAAGDRLVLAEIEGPGAVHHIWITVMAEEFYSKKLRLQFFWDGEKQPSVDSPLGDFFSVGWGIDRNVSSLPVTVSSLGRARNSYWYMPFRKSAHLEIVNEGSREVHAFYYYVDYRKLAEMADDTRYFHAQYKQKYPPIEGKNYTILSARGSGHYVGTSMSIMNRSGSWWGEGDDMIFIDGATSPTLHGTGSEDYFNDAWGMRESQSLFYGCSIQEEDFTTGSKASVYRYHIPDPIPFRKSIEVSIEHGHDNDRMDYLSSVAYWYQQEPHQPFEEMPDVEQRLPFAFEKPERFQLSSWQTNPVTQSAFLDRHSDTRVIGEHLSSRLTSFYVSSGDRVGSLTHSPGGDIDQFEVRFKTGIREYYRADLYFLATSAGGKVEVLSSGQKIGATASQSPVEEVKKITLDRFLPKQPVDSIFIRPIQGWAKETTFDLVSISIYPADRKFVREWNLIGPFNNSDNQGIHHVYPPEREIDLKGIYSGKDGNKVSWRRVKTLPSGFMNLSTGLIEPVNYGVVYGQININAKSDMATHLMIGSDDEVKVWLNGKLVHFNSVVRGCYPDQDIFPVQLKRGRNRVLIKVSQFTGGWGFYLRVPDPNNQITYHLN